MEKTHRDRQTRDKKFMWRGGRLFSRFRNINIALFITAFCVTAVVMLWAFTNILNHMASAYAARYGASSAEIFSARMNREIGLMSRAAHSPEVIEWFADEFNAGKKLLAHEELIRIVDEVYSYNVYVGFKESLNEYQIERDDQLGYPRYIAVFDENDPEDEWFFLSTAAEEDYLLSVGMDNVVNRKRVWINHRVWNDDGTLGIVSAGLDFSYIAGELFSQYDNMNMRGLIIDAEGNINMDSGMLSHEDYLRHDYIAALEDEFTNPVFLEIIKEYLSGVEGYFGEADEPAPQPLVARLPNIPYRFMTVTPIRHTDWSIIILYDSSPFFNISLFIPVGVIILIILIIFALTINAVSYRLIFLPLGKLDQSFKRLKYNIKEKVYGADRDDELGDLSAAVRDLFVKSNTDPLTGIYNRRYMESNLEYIIGFLARANAFLSVIMIDVDFFKKYNDTYGHERGDACLKEVAGALNASIERVNDFTARYGGEEFIAVLPGTGGAGAERIAEKLIKNIQDLNIPHKNNAGLGYVTISAGVASGMVKHTRKWEEYVKRADEALYMSKQAGRNRYTCLPFVESADEP